MSRIGSINTHPEVVARKYLFSRGFRYRKHYKILGRPDIVFAKIRLAIFINGCFWHQHGCNNSVMPKTNKSFWKRKLSGNIKRDKRVHAELAKKGWTVKELWECEINKKNKNTLDRLVKYIGKRYKNSYL